MDINDKIQYSQIKALVELTSQTSMDALVEVFVFNIKVIFPSKTILLITSHGPKALNRLAFTSQNLYGTVDSLLRRIGSLDPTTLPVGDLKPTTIIKQTEKSSWIQIPINTRLGTIGFLQVAGTHHEKNIFQAEMHITAFINQVLLLSLNERDALTRLYNREAFHEKISTLLRKTTFKRKSDEYRQYVLALLELDNLDPELDPNSLNNVLILTARMISDTFREYDWAFRFNSNQFAIVLHECDLELAKLALERLYRRLQEYDYPVVGNLSGSIGYTQIEPTDDSDVNLQRAQVALKAAKEAGGAQTICFEHMNDSVV
ncbi:MAG: GGDEF domain-containing protein [Gammaproteobacteria bacterium]|nr:GGDEF domain-containing protein [Gammaproteobacteria bacterium]